MPITINPASYSNLIYRFDSDFEGDALGENVGQGPTLPYRALYAWGANGTGKDATQPVFSSAPSSSGDSSLTGLPAFFFDSSSSQHLRLPVSAPNSDLSGATAVTIIAAVSVGAAAPNTERNLFAVASSGTSNNVLFAFRINTSNKLEVLYRPTPTASPVVVPSSASVVAGGLGGFQVLSARVNFATGVVNLYVNGSSVASATGKPTGSITSNAADCPLYSAIGIARKSTFVGNGWAGTISGLLVYRSELSTTDHTNLVNGYMSPKYITG